MRLKKTILLTAFFALIIALPLASSAKDKSQNVFIGEGQTIFGNLVKAGQIINIEADVPQDIIAVGQSVVINGNVKGDVLAAASSIRINGDVEGNIRVAGSNVEINGRVGKNLNAFGANVVLGEDSEIAWDVVAYGGSVEVRGKINGRMDGGGGSIIIAGGIGKGGKLSLGDGKLSILSPAIIGDSLEYVSEEKAEVADGAQIAGELKQTAPEVKSKTGKSGWTPFWWFSKVVSLFGLFVVGLVIVGVCKKRTAKVFDKMFKKPGQSILWGIVYAIATPIVLFLLLFTVIGIPLSLIGFALYLISLYLAKVFAGIAIGILVLSKIKKKNDISLMLAMVLGLIILILLKSIPFVGWIIGLVAMWWALGAIVAAKKEICKTEDRGIKEEPRRVEKKKQGN